MGADPAGNGSRRENFPCGNGNSALGRDTEGSWHPWICPTAPEGDSRQDPIAESLFFGNDRRLKPRIIPIKPQAEAVEFPFPKGENSRPGWDFFIPVPRLPALLPAGILGINPYIPLFPGIKPRLKVGSRENEPETFTGAAFFYPEISGNPGTPGSSWDVSTSGPPRRPQPLLPFP